MDIRWRAYKGLANDGLISIGADDHNGAEYKLKLIKGSVCPCKGDCFGTDWVLNLKSSPELLCLV